MEHVQTFLFADLAGFTALTEAHGDDVAADLVAQFCAAVRALLPGHEAEEVKAIGDALLLRTPGADAAVRLALAIAGDVGGRHRFPSVRVGMHTGPAVARDGDWFGATVNVASRVSDRARGGEVLATRATRDAAGALDGVEFLPRGRERLRNVGDAVEVFAVVARGSALPARRLVIDPVCRMSIDPDRAEVTTVHQGQELHFCSDACAQAFARAPQRYSGRHSRSLELRVSDNSRDRAVSFLRRAYERGELSVGELDERVSHALAARTRAEIQVVLRDLPSYRRWQLARRQRRVMYMIFPPLRWIGRVRRWWRRRRRQAG
jgi:adenylate cyclase